MSKVTISGNASGTGTLLIAAPNTNSDITLNLPATMGTNSTNAVVTTDAAGNLGLGVAPSAYTSGIKAIDIGTGSAIINPGSAGQTWYLTNAYHNSGFKYKNTGVGASWYQMVEAQHAWYTAPSGTAGAAISFVQAMTLNANGALALQGGNTAASGVGITFPATAVASSDVNTLDDYEEGTWTPKSGTGITVVHARYTKIGNVVTVNGTISHSGDVGSYDTLALPFVPSASGESRYTGGVQFFEDGTGTSAINIRLLTQVNIGANCFFWGNSGTQMWPYAMGRSAGNGIGGYTFTMTYMV